MPPRILVDGRSGSGKTEFAAALALAVPGAQLVRLDDIYPGWGGLEAGSEAVHGQILTRFRWRRFDWASNTLAEWHALDPTRPIIVEGCGALSAVNRALATVAFWVDLDEPTRKRRAFARDGDSYRPHWDEWAAQEDTFIARESPRAHADVIVDGADVFAELARWLSTSGTP